MAYIIWIHNLWSHIRSTNFILYFRQCTSICVPKEFKIIWIRRCQKYLFLRLPHGLSLMMGWWHSRRRIRRLRIWLIQSLIGYWEEGLFFFFCHLSSFPFSEYCAGKLIRVDRTTRVLLFFSRRWKDTKMRNNSTTRTTLLDHQHRPLDQELRLV